jgi:ureidoglycolate hydrolase
MRRLETYRHAGSGYNPFLIRDGWQVAQLNWAPELAPMAMHEVERHNQTDEVFIQCRGKSVLITAHDTSDCLSFDACCMRPGVVYNIPTGVWHAIAMWPDDIVWIVEKSHTHLGDVVHRELSAQEYSDLQKVILGEETRDEGNEFT